MKGPSFGSIKIRVSAFLRRKVALFGLSKITLGIPKMTFWVGPSWDASWGVKNTVKLEVFNVNLESFLEVFEVFFTLTRGFKL